MFGKTALFKFQNSSNFFWLSEFFHFIFLVLGIKLVGVNR